MGAAHARRFDRLAGVFVQPLHPGRPPRTFVVRRLFQPGIRAEVGSAGRALQQLEAAVRVSRFADDAGVVAAAGQHEGEVGDREVVQFADRMPRRDMVGLRTDAG